MSEVEERPAEPVRALFCGNRRVSASIIDVITGQGGEIVGVGLNPPPRASHAQEILDAAGVDPRCIFVGGAFSSEAAVAQFSEAMPTIGVCCGFSHLLPPSILGIPRWGWVNIHRSYLPRNRGVCTLQWAIIEAAPAGVSIHVMTEQVDGGPVIAQAEVPVLPEDDGQSLGMRADATALELFATCWPRLRRGDLHGAPQQDDLATYRSFSECEAMRALQLDAKMRVGRVIDIIRAFSGDGSRGACFEIGGDRFVIRAQIQRLPPEGSE